MEKSNEPIESLEELESLESLHELIWDSGRLEATVTALSAAKAETARRFTEAQVREAIQCAWGDATPADEDVILARLKGG